MTVRKNIQHMQDFIIQSIRSNVRGPVLCPTEFFFWTIPDHDTFPQELHGEDVVIPAGVYAGSADEGERYVQPFLNKSILDLPEHANSMTYRHRIWRYIPVSQEPLT